MNTGHNPTETEKRKTGKGTGQNLIETAAMMKTAAKVAKEQKRAAAQCYIRTKMNTRTNIDYTHEK